VQPQTWFAGMNLRPSFVALPMKSDAFAEICQPPASYSVRRPNRHSTDARRIRRKLQCKAWMDAIA